jgi:hypothetical protein
MAIKDVVVNQYMRHMKMKSSENTFSQMTKYVIMIQDEGSDEWREIKVQEVFENTKDNPIIIDDTVYLDKDGSGD